MGVTIEESQRILIDHTSSPAVRRSGRFWLGWSLALAGTLVVLILASLPPVVSEQVRTILMVAFSGVCHQISERSPHINGIQLAVCHRCYAIYAGLPLASLLYLGLVRIDDRIYRFAIVLLPLSVLPILIDWGLDFAGVWSNTPLSRMITGAIFGLVGGIYLSRALSSLFVRPPTHLNAHQ